MLDYRFKDYQITHWKISILLEIANKGSDTLKLYTSEVEDASPLWEFFLSFTSMIKVLRISHHSNRTRQQSLLLTLTKTWNHCYCTAVTEIYNTSNLQVIQNAFNKFSPLKFMVQVRYVVQVREMDGKYVQIRSMLFI